MKQNEMWTRPAAYKWKWKKTTINQVGYDKY